MSEYMCVFGEGSVSVHMCICVCLGVCPYVYEFIGAMYVNCSRDAKEVYSLKKKPKLLLWDKYVQDLLSIL